jgi:hypothetical protein
MRPTHSLKHICNKRKRKTLKEKHLTQTHEQTKKTHKLLLEKGKI